MLNKQALQSTESGKGLAGFIGTVYDGEITNLTFNADKIYNNTKGGLGGLIDNVEERLSLSHINVKIKEIEIASDEEYIGGLIHDVKKDTDIEIDDTYIQIDKIKHGSINKTNNSAAIIGNVEAAVKPYSLNISNCIVRIKSIDNANFSGVIGNIQPTYVSLNNLVIISDKNLKGSILGTDCQVLFNDFSNNYKELLKLFEKGFSNIVIASPRNECSSMILYNFPKLNPLLSSIFNASTLNISNSFYYNPGSCESELLFFKEYNADTIINELKASSTAAWELKALTIGGQSLKVPVFKAAGVLVSD